GFPPRPPWTRNWFDRFLVKLNITPFHVRKYIRDEMYVKRLLEDIAKICLNIGLRYSIKVDWENEYISFYRLDKIAHTSLCHEISFSELLGNDFDPRTFVLSKLHYKKH
ncbi:hypothetical protein ACFLTQ_03380, partial [Chloroflexota bacterium]